MPVRYTSPSLGGSGISSLHSGQWEAGFTYRWLHADEFFVGHDPAPTPNGLPVHINIHSVQLNLAYSASARLSVRLGIPLAAGSELRGQDDRQLHKQSASGLGDISLVASSWLFNPIEHGQSNISFGVGVKAPTGRSEDAGAYRLVSGQEIRSLDPSVQLGDGGWGIIAQVDAYARIARRTSAYIAGSYLANPRAHTDATVHAPFGIVPVAVTDEYSAHAGLSYVLAPRHGFTVGLGGRIDGVPVHDRFGGGDDSFRRPGYVLYVEPSVSYTLARSPLSTAGTTFTLSIPYRVDQNRMASALDIAHGRHGGGDFAKFLIFLGYSKRL